MPMPSHDCLHPQLCMFLWPGSANLATIFGAMLIHGPIMELGFWAPIQPRVQPCKHTSKVWPGSANLATILSFMGVSDTANPAYECVPPCQCHPDCLHPQLCMFLWPGSVTIFLAMLTDGPIFELVPFHPCHLPTLRTLLMNGSICLPAHMF